MRIAMGLTCILALATGAAQAGPLQTPTITEVLPHDPEPSATVFIRGEHFLAPRTQVEVTLGPAGEGNACGQVTVYHDDLLACQLPGKLALDVPMKFIVAVRPDGQKTGEHSAVSTAVIKVTVPVIAPEGQKHDDAPAITGISPRAGNPHLKQTLLLEGEKFPLDEAAGIRVTAVQAGQDPIDCQCPRVLSEKVLVCTLDKPKDLHAPLRFIVSTWDKPRPTKHEDPPSAACEEPGLPTKAKVSEPSVVTYVPSEGPRVQSVAPQAAPWGEPIFVFVTGSGFGLQDSDLTRVQVVEGPQPEGRTADCQNVTWISPAMFSCTVPPWPPAGPGEKNERILMFEVSVAGGPGPARSPDGIRLRPRPEIR